LPSAKRQIYRVLSRAGLLDRGNKRPSKKGTGFVQPRRPEHWHIDIAYLNIAATFDYLCSVFDEAWPRTGDLGRPRPQACLSRSR
jgi:hypothetical protein